MKGFTTQRPPYETGRIWVPLIEQATAGFQPTGATEYHGRTLWHEIAKRADDAGGWG